MLTTTPVSNATLRILVVDDNHDAANSMAMLLKVLRHEVQVAYDGPSAIAAAAQYQPQVVLLDLGMPGMNGMQTAQELQRSGIRSVLIALTGYGQDDDRRQTAEAGFHHHLVKPADLHALQNVLNEAAHSLSA